MIWIICPCCKLPTLPRSWLHEICPVCSWQNDGQNELDKYEVFGGPNKDYSLAEAQLNFRKYYTMFRPSDRLFTKLNKMAETKKELVETYLLLSECRDKEKGLELIKRYCELFEKINRNRI